MAAARDLKLTNTDKKVLQQAKNLIEYGEATDDKQLIQVGLCAYEELLDNPRKANAVQDYWDTLIYDGDMFSPEDIRLQIAFIQQRFYQSTGSGGASMTFIRRHGEQKSDEVINRLAVKDILQRKFDDIHPVVQKTLEITIPTTVSREYVPNGNLIIFSDLAAYANTWVPPTITPQPRANKRPQERPELWQEYLDRLMPKEHLCWWRDKEGKLIEVPQQDFFEAWLAQRVCQPDKQNDVSVVLRGNFGTGKGFWLDTIARELVGMANYQPVTTKAWKGDFNGDLFDSVIIHLEETNDTRANTADMLKMLITQDRHRANVKNLPQKFVKRNFAIAISSNHYDPIRIEEHDRRYFVPVWSDHKEGTAGKTETQSFFARFSDWLDEDDKSGFQVLRDWFEQVDLSKFNFRIPPETEAKNEIASKVDPSESRKDQLVLWLISKRDKYLAFTSSELAKANWPMTDAEVQIALRQAGYVTIQRRYNKEKKNLWLPKQHEGVKDLRKNGWSLYQRSGIELELPQEDIEVTFNPDERTLLSQLEQGLSVVISQHRHPNLKAYAESKGLLVNIMRPNSGGTIYGNDEDMNGKSVEERNRVCDEFEQVQSKRYTKAEIDALKGKVLMCRCKPARCHGDTLAKMANDLP